MRRLTGVFFLVLCVPPALAEQPLALRSSVETDWTSNATESTNGPADFFVEHEHELSATTVLGPMSLRGTLLFEQTRFATITEEDDMSAAVGLEAALQLDEGMVLRAGYAVTRDWTGEGLVGGDMIIGMASGKVTHEAQLGLSIVGGDQQVSVLVDGAWRYPEDTVISGLPFDIPPLRLDPEVAIVGVAVDWEKAVNDNVAALGRLKGEFSAVPEVDQLLYARFPGTAMTAAGGARIREGSFLVEVLAGAAMVWPLIDPGLRKLLPYLAMQSEVALGERWAVTGRAEKRLEMDDPLDPIASDLAELEFGARYALTDAMSVSASYAHSEENGVFDLAQSRRVDTAELRFDYGPIEKVRVSLSALRKWVREGDETYSVDRFAVALQTQF